MVFLYLYDAAFSISYAASKPIPKVYTGLLFLFESSNGNRAEIHKLKVFIDPLRKLKKLTWHNIFCGCNGITTEISSL